MVENLEESLKHFYIVLDDCRTMCDGPIKYDTTTKGFAQVNEDTVVRPDVYWSHP